jgi:PiT family inorganic phosphate transporter
MSGALAFSHGANDAQKSVGVASALLVADGHLDHLEGPVWLRLACAGALTLGTALGGWPIMRTVGRRIYRIRSTGALAAESSSAGVILGASLVGAPVSTTQVVASSVIGVGVGVGRWRHVRWALVRHMGAGWVVTMPAAAAIAALVFGVWEVLA